MRLLTGLALVATGTALSGCVSNTFSALSNLSTGCTTTTTSVNCGPPPTTTTTNTPPTTTTTTTNTNTGNTATLAAGDTTLALENNKAISTAANPARSKLAADPLLGSTATNSFTINTNTASNSSWPVTKTMNYYSPAGTTSSLADTPNYAEYRYFQKGAYDEELQVWSWGNSYTTQYRDVTNSGTAPVHQAWSFGGNYTPVASMPTANANVNYHGSWTATAQTSNWIDSTDPAQTVSHNNNWFVRGTSALTANFGTGDFNGRLTSTDWVGKNTAGGWTDVIPTSGTLNVLAPVMLSDVVLSGKITTSTAAGAHPNQIVGTANVDPANGWITTAGSNPMMGGFFGPGASEVAGVFSVDTANPSPVGGNIGINDDRRGFLSMSGMFHGTTP
jgi:hypothetical protein